MRSPRTRAPTRALPRALVRRHAGGDHGIQNRAPRQRRQGLDIVAKTPAQVAADPDAAKLLALCPSDQRPIIPFLAWSTAAWTTRGSTGGFGARLLRLHPGQSRDRALELRCDERQRHGGRLREVPRAKSVQRQSGRGAGRRVHRRCDELRNPRRHREPSRRRGRRLSLANSTTELKLVLPDTTKVHLYNN